MFPLLHVGRYRMCNSRRYLMQTDSWESIERQLSQFIKDTLLAQGRHAAAAAYRSAQRPRAQFITLPRHIISAPQAWYLGLGCWSSPLMSAAWGCSPLMAAAERSLRPSWFSWPVCIKHVAPYLWFQTPHGSVIRGKSDEIMRFSMC